MADQKQDDWPSVRCVACLALCCFLPGVKSAGGDWIGDFTLNGKTTLALLRCESGPPAKATLNLSFERVRGAALTELRVEPNSVNFQLPREQGTFVFEGRLEDCRISGIVSN